MRVIGLALGSPYRCAVMFDVQTRVSIIARRRASRLASSHPFLARSSFSASSNSHFPLCSRHSLEESLEADGVKRGASHDFVERFGRRHGLGHRVVVSLSQPCGGQTHQPPAVPVNNVGSSSGQAAADTRRCSDTPVRPIPGMAQAASASGPGQVLWLPRR